MKQFFLTLFAVVCTAASSGQSLEECRHLAREHYPEIRQYDLIAQTELYNISNAVKHIFFFEFFFAGLYCRNHTEAKTGLFLNNDFHRILFYLFYIGIEQFLVCKGNYFCKFADIFLKYD